MLATFTTSLTQSVVYNYRFFRNLRICLQGHHFSFPWRMIKILMSQDLFQNALQSIFLSLSFIYRLCIALYN